MEFTELTGVPAIRFPEMRDELRYAVAALSDRRYQVNVWLNGRLPRPGYEYDLDMAIHAILDDTEILHEPERLVGDLLFDQRELDPVRVLAEELTRVIREIGDRAPVGAYLSAPSWAAVIRAAKTARQELGTPTEFP